MLRAESQKHLYTGVQISRGTHLLKVKSFICRAELTNYCESSKLLAAESGPGSELRVGCNFAARRRIHLPGKYVLTPPEFPSRGKVPRQHALTRDMSSNCSSCSPCLATATLYLWLLLCRAHLQKMSGNGRVLQQKAVFVLFAC
jgi:hypothetical protein